MRAHFLPVLLWSLGCVVGSSSTDAAVSDAARVDAQADSSLVPDASGTDASALVDANALDSAVTSDASASDGGSGNHSGPYPGRHARTLGGRSYQVFTPSSYRPTSPSPLLIVLQGQGDDVVNMMSFWQSTAESQGFLMMGIAQTGSQGGWSTANDVPFLSNALSETERDYNVDSRRIYVWGFSAGAHLAHAIGIYNSDSFAAYATNAGTLLGYLEPSDLTTVARRIPIRIQIGRSDPNYPAASSDPGTLQRAGWVLGQNLEYVEFDGGHEIREAFLPGIWAFLSSHRL